MAEEAAAEVDAEAEAEAEVDAEVDAEVEVEAEADAAAEADADADADADAAAEVGEGPGPAADDLQSQASSAEVGVEAFGTPPRRRVGGDGGVGRAACALRKLHQSGLTYLRLEGMELGDAEIAELVAETRAGSAAALKGLYLGRNEVGDAGAEALAAALQARPGLTRLSRLSLDANRVGEAFGVFGNAFDAAVASSVRSLINSSSIALTISTMVSLFLA